MSAARFRPRPWPTAVALVLLLTMIGLGTWQMQRRTWKTELLATIATRMQAESVALPETIADPQSWIFRRVRIAGRFANDKALRLYGRTLDGKAGVHLLVPLIRPAGPAVLVDRGFVPFANADTLIPYATPEGDTALEGIVRLPEPGGWFTPATRPAENIWYGVDPAAMAGESGIPLAPYYVAAEPSGMDWPRGTGGTESLGIRNEHLNYAIFWYTMAVSIAVIYILSSRSRRV